MSADYYRRQVQGYYQDLAKLQEQKGREAAKVAEENRRANSAAESASRATSVSTQMARIKDAQRHQEMAARHQKAVADLEARIARVHGQLNDAQRRLGSAEQQEDRRRLQDQERAARAHEQRMSAISRTLTKHDVLHRETLSTLERLQELPEQVTVLFLAANPYTEPGEPQLRLAEEARAINEMIRKSEHRDAVRLESRWAVQAVDILQALSELQPAIVHFSGHGSEDEQIILQDAAGYPKPVRKEAIAAAMALHSEAIQLVFFNTCYSRGQAEAVVKHVRAAIGMNSSIGDDAARVFSAAFYSGIGFGYSVGRAFRQAQAALLLEGIPEDSTPELFMSDGLSSDDLVLVRPKNDPSGNAANAA